ncbi:helix-turn-helix domain-containing protein [Crocosphaera sp. XPORK-15E]|uniref:helix-turn-helix domain-containing protein n=1 Tax=Crocosphaera sp. XPORK-15E TaxID=3110247 RepID=UPI002B1F8689|nr:helix-turn-helix domain-containing protein [Crocosphaera sp. XPORK-15E]MEA5535668.1 helix-turn-helix domain-containing protein [Crocosphaera sp. XPORK-15E]
MAISNWFKQQLEVEIAQQLLLIVAKAQNISPKKVVIRRATVLKQAEEYMLSNLKSHITCQDICEAVGVSQRTLEYTFKDLYEITPKAYLKRLRLNHLRQCLQQSSPEDKILEFAQDLGFLHRGQLAKDYQQLFGELPSETKDLSSRKRKS